MRILFIDHPESDFLATLLFLGLCEELGTDNVVDWPYKESYHGKTQYYPSFYTEGGQGITAPFTWMIAQNNQQWSDEEVYKQITSFDLVILASPRINNIAALKQLIARVGRSAIKKLVLVDGEDSDSIKDDLIKEFKPSVYFKREMLKNLVAQCPIKPCPFASPIGIHPDVPKDIDVMNLGGSNYFTGVGRFHNFGFKDKQAFDEALKQKVSNVTTGYIGYDKYLDAINRSKMAIVLGGWGYDTLRLWEVPSFSETLMLMHKTLQMMPHPFIHEENCIVFSTFDELVHNINKYLADDAGRIKIAKAGNHHLRQYHTTQMRARYLIEESFK